MVPDIPGFGDLRTFDFSDSSGLRFDLPGAAVSNTPLPSTLPLFATGLGSLGLLGWHRKRKARVG
jgi:hypothetical protein